jgi:ribosomal protein S18 acetylase RimI-like enzyme
VRIREFRYPEDLPQVLQLWESIEKGVNLGRSDKPAEIEKKLTRDPDLFLVAQEESRIVGTVIGGYDGRRGLIYHLAVSAPYRERGLGSRMMKILETRLRSKGCLRCYLMVTKDNEEAMQYYERHGWERMDFVVPFAKNLD